MREKLITPFIVLLSLTITSVINIIYKVEFYQGTIRLFIVLIIFYIIGKVAEKIIIKAIKKDELKNSMIENDEVEDVMVEMTEE